MKAYALDDSGIPYLPEHIVALSVRWSPFTIFSFQGSNLQNMFNFVIDYRVTSTPSFQVFGWIMNIFLSCFLVNMVISVVTVHVLQICVSRSLSLGLPTFTFQDLRMCDNTSQLSSSQLTVLQSSMLMNMFLDAAADVQNVQHSKSETVAGFHFSLYTGFWTSSFLFIVSFLHFRVQDSRKCRSSCNRFKVAGTTGRK